MELVLAEWKEIGIMGIWAVPLSILIAKVFLLVVNTVGKIIVPELEPGTDDWKFRRYLARYNSEIELYSSRNRSLRLPSIDFVEIVNWDIEHDNGNTCFIPLLNLSQVERISFGKFVEHKKKLCYYHFVCFIIICILLGIFDYCISNNFWLMCMAFLILGFFLINKILFTWKEILKYEFLSVFLEEASDFVSRS